MKKKPQGILFSVESVQIIPATPMQWPLEDADTDEAITEPTEPMRFTKSFTFKMPKMKETKRKKLIRKLEAKPKLPRKLKKALKHLYVGFPCEKIEQAPDGFSYIMLEPLGTKGGYPRTRWIRKAEKYIRKQFVVIEKPNTKQQ